ncbi:MAG: aminoglycoside phosphotransferase family protein [Burkholderiaceae bacterium]
MDTRLDLLRAWLATLPPSLGLRPDSARPASNDASFRRYFRIDSAAEHGGTLVAMDAPPPMEDCRPFVHAAEVLGRSGISVPQVLHADLPRGFLLLEDFGTVTYLDRLDADSAQGLYTDAIGALVALQRSSVPDAFPPYDRELLLRELRLYPEWYVARHKGVVLDATESATLESAFATLVDALLAQPRVTVHRDFHSRNLMVLPGPRNPGILDFQDAVHGPITYDLVSLLRDAYVTWEEDRVLDWAIRYRERARAAGLPVPEQFGDFYRDFEWMGLQRHLKVLGIFARLHHRDGKDRYLADLPRVLQYVRETARRYSALGPLARLVDRVEGAAPTAGYTF